MNEDWSAEVEAIEERRAHARRMGGEAAVARPHANGRLTARDRVARMLDDGSFREVGSLAGRRDTDGRLVPNNQVVGRGRVDGRPVVVAADDFTIRGGS